MATHTVKQQAQLKIRSKPLFASQLLGWAQQYGRHDLPWQQRPTAYRVWVSEIMLQQTQVATVISYFKRFMRRFPSLRSLALADIDEVLELWAGLGYYRRAHFLHQAAKMLLEQFSGRFPRSLELLMQLPGVGRSTAGAILSLGMQQRAVILDANVKRVLARYYGLQTLLPQAAAYRELWQVAEQQTPKQQVAAYNQAMMDLGASVCTARAPACDTCPLVGDCQAYAEQAVAAYPRKQTKKMVKTRRVEQQQLLIMLQYKKIPKRKAMQAQLDQLAASMTHGIANRACKKKQDIFQCAGSDTLMRLCDGSAVYCMQNLSMYLHKRPEQGIWGGLWAFPMCDLQQNAVDYVRQKYQFITVAQAQLATVKHIFSHYTLCATPSILVGQASSSRRSQSHSTVGKSTHSEAWCNDPRYDLSGGLPALIEKLLLAWLG